MGPALGPPLAPRDVGGRLAPLAESTAPSPGDGSAPAGQTPAVRVLHRLRVACISMKTHLREIEKQAAISAMVASRSPPAAR